MGFIDVIIEKLDNLINGEPLDALDKIKNGTIDFNAKIDLVPIDEYIPKHGNGITNLFLNQFKNFLVIKDVENLSGERGEGSSIILYTLIKKSTRGFLVYKPDAITVDELSSIFMKYGGYKDGDFLVLPKMTLYYQYGSNLELTKKLNKLKTRIK